MRKALLLAALVPMLLAGWPETARAQPTEIAVKAAFLLTVLPAALIALLVTLNAIIREQAPFHA